MRHPITLNQLCETIPGSRIHGQGDIEIDRFVTPDELTSDHDLPLIMSSQVAQAIHTADTLPIKAAVISEEIAEKSPALLDRLSGALLVQRPRLALAELNRIFLPIPPRLPGIHPTAIVDESAEIDPTAFIGPYVCIEAEVRIGANSVLTSQITVQRSAVIGADCLLHPGVRIGPRVRMGDRIIIQSNACIGVDGFSYATPEESAAEAVRAGRGLDEVENPPRHLRIESLGCVVLEDDVEIGAGTTVDLATLGETRVKKGTKIDNLVQIGHNNTVGENCLVCAQVGIGGSSQVGDNSILAGQAGIADHLTIGEHSILMAKTGVIQDVEPKSILFGYPSLPHRDAMRAHALIKRLGDMQRDLRKLRKQVAALDSRDNDHKPSPREQA
jgi:UDP-3-O-[3-hydroxymyristoyl] glucosamine N-acyltransferase